MPFQRGARTGACRFGTRAGALPGAKTRREESRRCTHECVRHSHRELCQPCGAGILGHTAAERNGKTDKSALRVAGLRGLIAVRIGHPMD